MVPEEPQLVLLQGIERESCFDPSNWLIPRKYPDESRPSANQIELIAVPS
jgi:hypothetical protein